MKSTLKNNQNYKIGQKIFWKWLGREIHGQITSIHMKPISKVIKNKTIKRNGSAENPAYIVESEAGNLALKLHSELFVATTTLTKSKRKSPKMFQP
jgi:hypothetical protein